MSFAMVSGSNHRYGKVLWSPHDQPRFLVGGGDLRLYEYRSKGTLEPPDLSLVAIHTDLPLMKCFDWSYDTATPNLVAVGQSTGKVCLVKLQPTHALPRVGSPPVGPTVGTAFPSSPQPHSSPGYEPSLSGVAGTILTLNVRHTRACNAIAFSKASSNLLATGFEKVRNDSSLWVWDLSTAVPTAKLFPGLRGNLNATVSPEPHPVRASSLGRDAVGDFLPNRSLPLAPANPIANGDEPPHRQYCPSEAVFSLAWLAGSTHEVLGGLGLKRIRLFDLRDPGSSPIFTTKAVYGIQIDPFRPHRFLSHSEDGLVKVWDRRRPAGPLLAFQADGRGQQLVVRFSPTQPNQVAILDREDTRVRAISLVEAREVLGGETLAVWRTRQALESQRSLTSFCWVPSSACGKANQALLCLTREGALESYPVGDPRSLAWGPTGLATVELGQISIHGYAPNDASFSPGAGCDATHVMLTRARAGYGLEAATNKALCTLSPDLVELWGWVERIVLMQQAGLTKLEGVEFAFQGLLSILTAGSKAILLRKSSQSPASVARLAEAPAEADLEANPSPPFRKPPFERQQLRLLPKHRRRQLALDMLNTFGGTGCDEHDVEALVTELESAGDWERAVACALLMVSLERAVQVLRRSGVERHRLMVTALMGRSSTNEAWGEQCRATALALPEPGLRAVFLYAWRESWADVLEHAALPLRDRLWIATRHLEAEHLRRYLERLAAELVPAGSIVGVILTGLHSTAAHDLISSYVDRTGDVQSAAVLVSFAPRSSDPRGSAWVELYRELLDRWGLWRARCRFDIARRQAALRLSVALSPPPPQVVVRCNFCNANVGPPFPASQPPIASPNVAKPRRSAPVAGGASPNPAPTTASSTSPKPTACPNCKKPLPRCALCLLHLGTPADPSGPLAAALATGDGHSPTTPLSTGSQVASKPTTIAERILGGPPPANPVVSPTPTPSARSFDYWFAWCQTCRHGGHSAHLAQWFQRHTVCPVAECRCTCSLN
ncbi:hypothetical protein L0F63_002152 [Massospora cicadina]|nr:hypothetical protein L0F63_002152 [Massospora cicadina]